MSEKASDALTRCQRALTASHVEGGCVSEQERVLGQLEAAVRLAVIYTHRLQDLRRG